jgi:hypothetical protein
VKCNAILLAGAAAVLPALVPGWAARAAEPPKTAVFIAPETPLILTRTLRRGLADGKEVVTRRSYEVRIVPEDGGFRVDGRLLDTQVDAPPGLAVLAQIERARPETGLFPIRLDRTGLIVPRDGSATGDTRAAASSAVRVAIDRSALGQEEKAAASAFVDQVRRTRIGVSSIPADLFRPRQGRRVEQREVSLADGQVGDVTIEVEARVDAIAGLLESLEQTVVTELEGTRRTNREKWTLARLR